MFFKELSEVLELDLSAILRAISTEAQLQGLDEKELPYLKGENIMMVLAMMAINDLHGEENQCCNFYFFLKLTLARLAPSA